MRLSILYGENMKTKEDVLRLLWILYAKEILFLGGRDGVTWKIKPVELFDNIMLDMGCFKNQERQWVIIDSAGTVKSPDETFWDTYYQKISKIFPDLNDQSLGEIIEGKIPEAGTPWQLQKFMTQKQLLNLFLQSGNNIWVQDHDGRGEILSVWRDNKADNLIEVTPHLRKRIKRFFLAYLDRAVELPKFVSESQ